MTYFKMISLIGFIQSKPTQTDLQCLFDFLANYENIPNKTNVYAQCLPTFSTYIFHKVRISASALTLNTLCPLRFEHGSLIYQDLTFSMSVTVNNNYNNSTRDRKLAYSAHTMGSNWNKYIIVMIFIYLISRFCSFAHILICSKLNDIYTLGVCSEDRRFELPLLPMGNVRHRERLTHLLVSSLNLKDRNIICALQTGTGNRPPYDFEHSRRPYFSPGGLDRNIKSLNELPKDRIRYLYRRLLPKVAGAMMGKPINVYNQLYPSPSKYKKVTSFVRLKYILSKLVLKKTQHLCFELKQLIKKWYKNNVYFLIKKFNIKLINTFKYLRQFYIILYFIQKIHYFMADFNIRVSHVKNYSSYASTLQSSPILQNRKASRCVRSFENGPVVADRKSERGHSGTSIRNLAFYVTFFLQKILWNWVKKRHKKVSRYWLVNNYWVFIQKMSNFYCFEI